ncbi:MAG: M13 family peptidase, partial [Chitinophagaceae bacterium]
MKKKLLIILLSILFFTMARSQKTHFIDSANMNFAVKPGDNFYEYANGTWLKNTPMPKTETRWGSFHILREKSIQQLRNLLTEAIGNQYTSSDSLVRKVGKFYAVAMDSLAAEKLGYVPILGDLKAIEKIKNKKDLLLRVAQFFTKGNQNFFHFYVDQDAKNVAQYIAQLGQSGLGMPDKDYYFKKDLRTLKAQEAYKKYNKTLFMLIGNGEKLATQKANEVFNLEKQIATLHFSRVELRNPVKRYNKIAVAIWSKEMKLLQFHELIPIISSGKKIDSLVMDNPRFFIGIDSLLEKTSISVLKNYLEAHLVQDYAPYLSNVFVMADFIYHQALSGQKEIQPRYKRMIQLTDKSIGE